MKYIKIKNKGLIEPEALHLVGATSKRNDSTKIGQFGSGNKYALAYLLRNDYEIKIFSGLSEIKISRKESEFRGNKLNIICINNVPTSITDDMGKNWQFWQAIREIYCNALDEGEAGLDFVGEIEPEENNTHFYISTSKDVMEFISNFDNYFAVNKKILFECEHGKILEKSGETANIYRKGIRCFNTKKVSVFDYDFNEIDIDENRLVSYYWEMEAKVWDLIYQCTNKEVISSILHKSSDSEYLEGCLSDLTTLNSSRYSNEFKEFVKSINVAPKGYAGLLNPDEVHNHIIIPTKVFESIRGVIGDENVGDKFKVSRNNLLFREIEMSLLHQATLKKALDFLSESDFKIQYEIKAAVFDDKNIFGCAYNDLILISEICFEAGVNQVVQTIIEEYIHIKYKVFDETRGFQDAVIKEMVTYMKKKNAYLI